MSYLNDWWRVFFGGMEYPYTDSCKYNDDWLLEVVKKLVEEFANFVNLNKIKYANPILWDITRSYETNTVVVDGRTGNAYISVKAVPAGVQINRTEYWTQIYNYADVVDTIREQIAFNEGDTTTASKPFEVGELVFLSGLLYRVIAPMIAGDSFVIDSNIVKTTIYEELVRVSGLVNDLADNVGELSNLDTEDKTSLVAAINEVLSTINATTGDLESLTTEDKTSLVAAINEVLSTINATTGDLENLTTEDKTSLVAAINEVLSTLSSDTETLTEEINGVADLIPYVNVKAFGAKGDGVTDDTAAFQAALAALNEGDVLYIPNGTYPIAETLTVNKQIRIQGTTSQDDRSNAIPLTGSVLKYTGTGSGFLIVKNDGVEIDSVTLIGTDSSQASAVGLALQGDFGGVIWNLKISNMQILKFKVGVKGSGVLVSTFRNVHVSNAQFGFLFNNDSETNTSLTFISCWARYTSVGYSLNKVSYSSIIGCACDVAETGYSLIDCVGVTVQSCGCELATDTGFATGGGSVINLIGCVATACGTQNSANPNGYRTYAGFITLIGCECDNGKANVDAILGTEYTKLINCNFAKNITYGGITAAARDSFVGQTPVPTE